MRWIKRFPGNHKLESSENWLAVSTIIREKTRNSGLLSPSIDAIAKAFQGRDAVRLQPSGAYAANRLGLSDQVPMKVVFLTDGSSRRIQLGKLQIILKRTTPRNMVTAGKVSGLMIQAFRFLGQRHVNASVLTTLSRRLSDADKRQLLRDFRYAPAWIARFMRQIAACAIIDRCNSPAICERIV